MSDHNTKFMSTFWRELHKLMGTKLLMSTAFHPQMDCATEWANRSIGQLLRMIINDDQKNWADKCPMIEFALNSSVSTTTGFAPFELNQRYMPQIGMPTSFDTMFKGFKQFTLQVKWDLMVAHDTISRIASSKCFMPIRNAVPVIYTMWEITCICRHRTLPYLKAG